MIRKRTLASQMADAELEKTTVTIIISGEKYTFEAEGEVIIFDGFLKVYMESFDDEKEDDEAALLPAIRKGDQLQRSLIQAQEQYTSHPPRYTEASLVKKMENLGIGRPSTYAPTITTIQNRGYILPGKQRRGRAGFGSDRFERTKYQDKENQEDLRDREEKTFPLGHRNGCYRFSIPTLQ